MKEANKAKSIFHSRKFYAVVAVIIVLLIFNCKNNSESSTENNAPSNVVSSDALNKNPNESEAPQELNNNRSLSETELSVLRLFQTHWADSIVKDHEGIFITDRELYLPDTIQFYLSKAASKNVAVTREQTLGVYTTLYNEAKVRLPEKLRNYPVVIDFLPARGYKIENWVKYQGLAWQGVELYSGQGNEKKKVGSISGGYDVDGDRFIVVSKKNGQTEVIPTSDLRRYAYYFKAGDPNMGKKMLIWQVMSKK